MKTHTYFYIILSLVFLLILSSCTLMFPPRQLRSSIDGRIFEFSPVRSFEIDGGFIDYQVLAVRTRGRPSQAGMRAPTTYMLNLKNQSKFPIYLIVEWKFTETDTIIMSSKVISERHSYRLVRNANYIIEEIKMPLKISIFSDMDHSKKIGEESTSIFFGKEGVAAYRELASRNFVPVISGFPEMSINMIKKNISDSIGDDAMQKDIQLLLWKEESKKRRDCKHEALNAKKTDIASSVILSTFSEKLRKVTLRLAKKDLAIMEVWKIRSCDTESSYEVLMVKDPESGTNIVTKLIK